MDYFPLFVKLQGWTLLIVGGGSVALRKAKMLQRSGGDIRFVATEFSSECADFIEKHQLQYECVPFALEHLNDVQLVVSATNDEAVNRFVYEEATARKILVNVVDDAPHCRFIFPSIVDRSPLVVAISSSGHAPVLARHLRQQLELMLPQYLGALADLAGSFRGRVKKVIKQISQRRFFWEQVFGGDVADLLAKGQRELAERSIDEQLQAFGKEDENSSKKGTVYLVGAGPGNPDLLTIRALQLMQCSDVVVYDRLVSKEVLELVRRDAVLISVAKEAGFHSVPQEEINQLLVDEAKKGLRVCRLKGGDPFVFGRGGEEVAHLVKNQISFQVVPGVTAASGCTAYAGIPLTHRSYAHSVQFLAGQCKKGEPMFDNEALNQSKQTLVVYMGLSNLEAIVSEVVMHGRESTTPVAIIENGTMPSQRVIVGTLATIASLALEEKVKSPALLVIGDVVRFQEEFKWFY